MTTSLRSPSAFCLKRNQGLLSTGPDIEGLCLAGREASRAVWIPTAALVLTHPDPTEPQEQFQEAAEVLRSLAALATSEFRKGASE